MKKILNLVCLYCFVTLFIGCTKYTALNNNNTTTTTTTTATVVAPRVKFFNVMDFGSTYVFLNSVQVTSVAKYYASSYITAKEGANTIKIAFADNQKLLEVTHTFANNTSYSCFFYKVGNEWKSNVVKDDLPTGLATGFAALRVLDFRTEAYFNYINVRLICPGFDIIDQKNRNFLDHTTYEGYTQFTTSGAGSYGIYMYNDTITSSYRKGVTIDSKGIYSVVLTTPTGITPYTNAIYQIFPDVVKHN
ncbi:MAG: hypothetical protein ACOVO1_13370 [Chitinophagaceae bacterium]